MQPYFFPYIGYYQLIVKTDKFIFLDNVQYIKNGWINRNRILHPVKQDGFRYITVPIKKFDKTTLIRDIKICNDINWQKKILNSLHVYKILKAPFYNNIYHLLKKVLSKQYYNISDLSIESIKAVCDYLGIKFNYEISSNLNLDLHNINQSGDWALEISKQKKASEYINPYSGYFIFDENKFNENGIKLNFLKPNLSPYKQSRSNNFNSSLSILDLIMFNSIKDSYKLISSDCVLSNSKI